ncbi:hypothetical protein [Saccharibacillus alkalitolerans]|uniref:Uncharacterized protein n=1 Tax=Saccharibacillus alkalitolerans TaxID=2705290 RepID=A0ABX0F4I6_9BACL|nr:hypothetical protein [Saccharibacillus alkalitolerans]NGZ74111.1 hypothetical protein [Saccharibacillus alkalitolerans]
MYGHTFSQALCKLGGDELRLVYVLCCDTAVQELLVSKIRDWIRREPERFARQLEEKAAAYRDWNDNELRLAILLELAKRARLVGAPLTTAAELEEYAGGIVEQIELGAAEEDRAYYAYREGRTDASELETLIDYQIASLVQALGRLLDAAPQPEWDEYMLRVGALLPDMPETWDSAADVLPNASEGASSGGIRLDKAGPEAREGEDGTFVPLEAEDAAGEAAEGSEPAGEPAAPARPSGERLLLAALERQQGFAYYETAMTLLASAEGLLGTGTTGELYGRRIAFLAVSGSPVFLSVLPGGAKAAQLSLRGLNPQRRRLPLLLTQLLLPELVSEDETQADYEPLLSLWRSRAEAHGAVKADIGEEDSRIDYYKRESASCAQQLESARSERVGSEERIAEIRESLVNKLRVSSMQLPPISDSFDRLLEEYADNRNRIADAEASRQERRQGLAGLVKYTINYAASSVTLLDLRRKQDRLLERMADEALHTDGEWGQGERYVVAAERERIGHLDAEIGRLEKLQADYREELRRAEQARKTLEQEKKKLEKQVYGLADL